MKKRRDSLAVMRAQEVDMKEESSASLPVNEPVTLLGKVFGELLGTAALVMVIVGSGTMAQNLTSDSALQLLINSLSTALALFILIIVFEPISGSHFNPVVTIVILIKKEIRKVESLLYLAAQFLGATLGVASANIMFDRTILEFSTKGRIGSNLLLSEVIATAGLIFVIFASWVKISVALRATLVASWIGSAYFFTSSTSVANPAVTFGRMWSDTFSGISPDSVTPFILAQLLGGIFGAGLIYFFTKVGNRDER
ncbi:MAG: aquaporin family protein [Actinobacteria bacterium]|nr:aquaporin family protein [Actinomycetota bacterium]